MYIWPIIFYCIPKNLRYVAAHSLGHDASNVETETASKYKLRHLEKEKLTIFGNKFPILTQWSALNFLNMYFSKLDISGNNLKHYFQQLIDHLYRKEVTNINQKTERWKHLWFGSVIFKHKYGAMSPIFRTLILLNSKFKFFASALPQAATTTN